MNMRTFILPPIINAAIWSLFSIALALPILRQIHHIFGLSSPPISGLLLLGFGLVISFLGAAIVGALCGAFGGKRSTTRWGAGFVGLLWSLFTALWMFPTYAGFVADELARQGATTLIGEREDLLPRAKSAVEAYQKGKLADEAHKTGGQALTTSRNLAATGLARLPPLLIFAFAIIGAPFVAFFECRRMQRL